MAGNSKNFLPPHKIIEAGDMSLASITSDVTTISYLDNVGIQIGFTGTPTGSFDVQISNDNATWTSLVLSPAPVAAGSADNIYIDMNQLSAVYIRLVYTRASGSGVLNAVIVAKAV